MLTIRTKTIGKDERLNQNDTSSGQLTMDLRSLGGSTWKGFSDQELQGIKKHNSPPSTSANVPNTSNTSTNTNTSTSTKQLSVTLNTTTKAASVSTSSANVVESKPVAAESSQQEETKSCDPNETKSCDLDKTKSCDLDKTKSCDLDETKSHDLDETKSCDLDETKSCDLVEPRELLEEQLRRRREIEEANKKKKKALEETISQRYKQTRAESTKLEMVKNELARLDQLVTKDVAILRDTIETASRDYTAAKLRFERAESEYVSAKLALATSREKKDLLSQHLCSVIQENEQRKAAKLTELMSQLDIHEQS